MKFYQILEKAGFESLASDPSSPFVGQVWLNTTSNTLKYKDSSSVQTIGTASSGITEELGTWTPTFTGSTGSITASYSQQYGYYIKHGKLITCFGRMILSSISSPGSGTLTLAGLPYTIANDTGLFAHGDVTFSLSFNSPNYPTQLRGVWNTNTMLFEIVSSSGVTDIPVSALTGTSFINFVIVYKTV